MTYNFKLDIATAPSRLSKTWRNAEMEWSELVQRCTSTRRTLETAEQYAAMSRDQQSRVKDVGGFVAGYLMGGQRHNANVATRSAVTLDLDYAEPDTWATFAAGCEAAAVAYSTHKHTAEHPRIRLVLPSDRPMGYDEYEPCARYWAARVGIDTVDDTTYQTARLFYWPSTPQDGEFFCDVIDLPPFSVDKVLATYADWHDASSWPLSSREQETRARRPAPAPGTTRGGNAEDPTAKPGLIGAFCRAHSIEDVIETMLPDRYKPTGMHGRYTYADGTVSGGLVCYDGKFAYSHHDHDPAGGQCCNAFDLVRIHKFGHLDTRPYEDITRAPSYAAMMDFAGADEATRQLIAGERAESLRQDFGDLTETQEQKETEGHKADKGHKTEAAEAEAPTDWMAGCEELRFNKKGDLHSTATNIMAVLENDPRLKGKIWHNEFSGFDMTEGALPWPRRSEVWTNADDANLRIFLEREYGITGRERIRDAFTAVLSRHSRHPVREYLARLRWDGVPRLERLIIDYVGAEDTELTRAMTRKHFTAAVRRIFHPGCKYDYCLILAGPEGIGKSTLFAKMAGEYFSDSVSTAEGKSSMEQLRNAWIIELAELSSIKRSDVETVKSYISRQNDIYRPAYGSVVENHPRQCIFCGTTNEDYFLKGSTGNRRFWVIRVDPALMADQLRGKDVGKELAAVRDQVWAEAAHYERAGEKLYLDKELEAQARLLQEACNDDADDIMPSILEAFLETELPANWENRSIAERRVYYVRHDPFTDPGVYKRQIVCPAEFLAEKMGMDLNGDKFRYYSRRVARALRELGWEGPVMSRHAEKYYGIQKSYKRPEEAEPEEL